MGIAWNQNMHVEAIGGFEFSPNIDIDYVVEFVQ